MTTNELKSYVNRILGNNMRLLLPSYWWKRAFGAVIDNTVSADSIKTINGESVIGEGDLRVGVKNVESVEALETLDAVVGDLATVAKGGKTVGSFNDLAFGDRVTDVEFMQPPYAAGSCSVVFTDKEGKIVGFVTESNGTECLIGLVAKDTDTILFGNEKGIYPDLYAQAMTLFKERECAFDHVNYDGISVDSFVRPVVSAPVVSDAYIKGETWKRLLKEGDIVGSSESVLFVSPLSEGKELTEDEKAINAESYRKIVDGFNDGHFYDVKIFGLYATIDASIIANPALTDNNVLKLMFMTPSAAWAILTVMEDGSATLEEGDVTGGGGSLPVYFPAGGAQLTEEYKAANANTYSALLRSNTLPLNFFIATNNGVACYPIYSYYQTTDNATTYINILTSDFDNSSPFAKIRFKLYSDGVIEFAEYLNADSALSTTSTNAVQNKVVTSALNDKADKSQIPTKLSQLEKDIEIGASITVDSELSETSENPVQNKVVYGLAVAVDEHTEQLETYLNYTTQSITRIDEQIATKQDTIVDLATIRSNAAKGATALQSVPSEYITESELNARNYATATQLTAKQDTISDLATIRSNATLGSTAIQKVKTINGESITGEGNVELLTKALYDELVENMLENEEVYAAAVNDLNTRMENNRQHGEETYATKAELLGEITDITNSIVENEEVIAATLNDLLARIDALVTRIETLENA